MRFKTLERVGNKLRLLDQTKLPLQVEYHDLDDYREVVEAIKHLQVRGAPAIGIAAAYGMAIAVEQSRDHSQEYIEKVASHFKAARPTAVNLAWAVNRVLAKVSVSNSSSLEGILSLMWGEAEAIHEEDRLMCEKIGKFGAELIKDGDAILTHCNAGALATGGIGTALGVIYTCRDQGKNTKVFVNETRPLLQGARLTAWELQQEEIDTTLICDNMAGMLMHQGKIGHVIVGADRIAKNGDVANKIGTYSIAVLAKEHNVPFYVAAPYSTFDNEIESGDQIPIEERSPLEVTEGFGKRIAPEGVKVYSPAFDVTPHDLVSYYITDEGLKQGPRKT